MGKFKSPTEKVGLLTILDTKLEKYTNKKNRKFYTCKCDCGTIVVRRADYIASGKCTSCGCDKKRFENLIGKRFGFLTVISLKHNKNPKQKRYSRIWVCRCVCGNKIEVKRPDSLKCGSIKSCGCYSKITIKKAIKAHTLPKGESAFNALYEKYKKEAEKRNLIFRLTKPQLKDITKKVCHYCGKPPVQKCKVSNNGNYVYNGIDRTNNRKGYSLDNCVPCCKVCNFIKGVLSKEEFLDQVRNIFNFNNSGLFSNKVKVEDFNNHTALNVIYWEYKKNAKIKKLNFKLNKKKFKKIIKASCYLCGELPTNIRYTPNKKWKYTFNGIDRIDSSLGYLESNCKPCCKKCNYMKREYKIDIFLQQIEKIFGFLK